VIERPLVRSTDAADRESPLQVCCAAAATADARRLERTLCGADSDGFGPGPAPVECETVTTRDAVLDALAGSDCVVSATQLADGTGLDLLAAVRERRQTHPFVLVASQPLPNLIEERRRTADADSVVTADPEAMRWTDVVYRPDPDRGPALLASRVERLVTHRQTAVTAERVSAAIETAREGIAIVDADGRYAVVNRAYATRFGFDRDELLGTPWRDRYTADSVERIETAALPPAADGWRWVGEYTGRHRNGATLSGTTGIFGFQDGSLVLTTYEGGGPAGNPPD
jgi:PAS domain S-box-containing protein